MNRTEKNKRRALISRRWRALGPAFGHEVPTGWSDEQRERMSAAQKDRWKRKREALGLSEDVSDAVETETHSSAGSADSDLAELPEC